MQAIFIDAVRRRDVSGVASENKNRQPLTTSQLDLLVEAFQVVQEEPSFSAYTNPTRQQSIAVANAQMYNAQMAAVLSNLGQISTADRVRLMQSMQQSVAFSNAQFRVAMSSLGRIDTTVRTVVNELRFAGRAERAEAFLTAQCESANTESQLASLCEHLLSAKRFNMIEPPLSRWFDLRLSHLRERNATGPVASAVASPTASPTSSSEDPTEFAIRFLERLGEQVSVESAVKILDLSMATSNQKFLNRDFPPLNNWSLVATQAISWQGQIPASISVPFWCRSFVTELDQKILQAAVKCGHLR